MSVLLALGISSCSLEGDDSESSGPNANEAPRESGDAESTGSVEERDAGQPVEVEDGPQDVVVEGRLRSLPVRDGIAWISSDYGIKLDRSAVENSRNKSSVELNTRFKCGQTIEYCLPKAPGGMYSSTGPLFTAAEVSTIDSAMVNLDGKINFGFKKVYNCDPGDGKMRIMFLPAGARSLDGTADQATCGQAYVDTALNVVTIWLNQAAGCVNQSTVHHEAMHAFGIEHEQTRSDRDNFVRFYPERTLSTYLPNFTKDSDEVWKSVGYDFDSIMEYGSFSFVDPSAANTYTMRGTLPTLVRKATSTVLYRSTGTWRPAASSVVPTEALASASVAGSLLSGDVTNDDLDDLVYVLRKSTATTVPAVFVWSKLAGGRNTTTFGSSTNGPVQAFTFSSSDGASSFMNSRHFQLADFDRDGHADLLWHNGTKLFLMKGSVVSGAPRFSAPAEFASLYGVTNTDDLAYDSAAGFRQLFSVFDFSGDGAADILYTANTGWFLSVTRVSSTGVASAGPWTNVGGVQNSGAFLRADRIAAGRFRAGPSGLNTLGDVAYSLDGLAWRARYDISSSARGDAALRTVTNAINISDAKFADWDGDGDTDLLRTTFNSAVNVNTTELRQLDMTAGAWTVVRFNVPHTSAILLGRFDNSTATGFDVLADGVMDTQSKLTATDIIGANKACN